MLSKIVFTTIRGFSDLNWEFEFKSDFTMLKIKYQAFKSPSIYSVRYKQSLGIPQRQPEPTNGRTDIAIQRPI